MNILTRNDFIKGCQFQIKGSHEKGQLYISEYNEAGHFILLDYDFACEYGKDSFRNLSRVIFNGPDFFVFQYRIFGEPETVQRYYRDFEIVNYKKHLL